jgi:hypothetical protein
MSSEQTDEEIEKSRAFLEAWKTLDADDGILK